MKKCLSCLIVFLALALLFCACGQSALEPTPTPEPTASPTPEPTPTPTPEPTPEPTPTPDAHQVFFQAESDAYLNPLFDDNFLTWCSFDAGSELSFRADEPVGGVYLVWNTFPSAWTLSADGVSVEAGTNGYLHEYVPLPVPSTEFTIHFPADTDMDLCDIYAVSEGILPDWVQLWLPPCETADILVVPTHADDEFIFFGGILPSYAAERGLEVQVLYMTSHYIGSERHRCHEKLNGLWIAGVRHYPVTNMVRDYLFDSYREAAGYYGPGAFTEFQVQQIRRFKPLVIVEHDENGEYGHAVHRFNAYSMEEAVVLAADPSYDPDSAALYGVWDTPKTYLHLYGEPDSRTSLNYETPLDFFGGKTAYEVALQGLNEHHSQLIWDFEVYSFDSPFDSHSFGLYRSLVGPDIEKNDLMENISISDWRG